MSETLILIPGLLNTRDLFRDQIAALSVSRQVSIADHTQDASLPAMAERLLKEAPPRFALAGLSMGGYLALEVMRQAPGRVTRLGLLDTSARPDTDEARGKRERLIALAEEGRFGDVPSLLMPEILSPEAQTDEGMKERLLAMMMETGPQAFIRQERAIMARSDSRGMLPSIEIPTLVLVGEKDTLTPPEVAREMSDLIEWASLVVIPGAGHLSALERPEAVTNALEMWLTCG